MKVIKKGREQTGWAKELSCDVEGGCGAILLVEEGDLFYRRGGEDYEGGCCFVCACCSMENKLDKKVEATVPNVWTRPATPPRQKKETT